MRRPANDDRELIGQILRSIQRRPARTSYLVATVFAVVWVIAGGLLGWMYLPELKASLGPSGLSAPILAVLAMIFFAPIIFFFVLAHMAWRSQELRLITQSMAEVAMRLAEPETVARELIVTVGQAIRREVAAMGDGIERALARAAELETLVANEVSALEHAYNDNEVRIRGAAAGPRQASATRWSARPTRFATPSTASISTSATTSPRSANWSPSRSTRRRAGSPMRWPRRASTSRARSEPCRRHHDRGARRARRRPARPAGGRQRGDHPRHRAASDRLTSTLNFKTDHIGDEFTEITANLQHMMSVRLDRVTEGFAQKSASILDMMTEPLARDSPTW